VTLPFKGLKEMFDPATSGDGEVQWLFVLQPPKCRMRSAGCLHVVRTIQAPKEWNMVSSQGQELLASQSRFVTISATTTIGVWLGAFANY